MEYYYICMDLYWPQTIEEALRSSMVSEAQIANIVFWPDCNYSLICVIHKMKFPINDVLVSGHKTKWWRSNVQ